MEDPFAQIDVGRAPPGLEHLLAEGLGEPDPEDRPRGLFRRWSRPPPPPEPSEWRFCKLVRHDDAGFFRSWRIVMVYLFEGPRLEGHMLPIGGSFGLFAVRSGPDAEGYRGAWPSAATGPRALYLSRRRVHLEAVLRDEGRSPLEADPRTLAAIVVEALGRRGNSSHTLVESAEQVAEFDRTCGWNAARAGGYAVDRGKLARVADQLVPAVISLSDDGAEWLLTCCTVFGWMHDKRTLLRHQYRIRRDDFSLRTGSTVLSERIFRSIPNLRY